MRAILLALSICFVVATATTPATAVVPVCAKKVDARTKVVVVDAESSGVRFAPLLKVAGYRVYHLRTREVSIRTEDFEPLDLHYDGKNFEAVLAAIRELGVAAVIPGSETAVEVTNRLHVALGFPSHEPALFHVLQDKYLQQELLKAAGLPSIPQIKTGDVDNIIAWVRERERLHLAAGRSQERAWPVVIRPFNSSGSDGLFVCHNEAEIRAARAALRFTKRGIPIDEVLVQEYIPGQEYAVGIEAVDGEYLGSMYFAYVKERVPRPEGGFSEMYKYDRMLPFDGPVVDRLRTLSFQVARVFGHRNGSGHPEFKITPEGDIYLIEWNARAMGGINPELVTAAVGIGPIEMGIEARLNRSRLRERIRRAETPRLNGAAWIVQFNCRRAGTLIGLPLFERLREFPLLNSPTALTFKYKLGDRIPVTVDLKSSPGEMAWLIKDTDPATAEARMVELEARFRRWEREEGFYELAEDVVAPLAERILAVGAAEQPARGSEVRDALLSLMAHRAFQTEALKRILLDVLAKHLRDTFEAEHGGPLRERIRAALPGLLVTELLGAEGAVAVWTAILSRAQLHREGTP